jgi:hypothetical protein
LSSESIFGAARDTISEQNAKGKYTFLFIFRTDGAARAIVLARMAESLPMIFTKFIKLKILYIENYVDCDFLNVLRASWFSS